MEYRDTLDRFITALDCMYKTMSIHSRKTNTKHNETLFVFPWKGAGSTKTFKRIICI